MRTALCLLGLILLPCGAASDVGTQPVVPVPTRDPLAPLLRNLRNEDTETRIHAAKALYELGPRVAPATQTLIAALADPEAKVREHVVDALTEIGPRALRSLAEAVKKGDTQTRLLAIDVCDRISVSSKVGEAVKDISPALIFCLDDKDPLLKQAAVRCLGDLRAASGVPRLVKLLEEEKGEEEKDIEIRLDAIIACGQIGKEAKEAVPVLARMVVSEYDKIVGNYSGGEAAADALAGIGEPAESALACLVADVKLSPGIRCTVLQAMSLESQVMGVKFAAVVPAMCKAAADREEKVRLAAIYALEANGSTDKHIRAALRTVMTDDKIPYLRGQAASALYRLDGQAKVVLPTLLRLLEDKELCVRRSACSALNMGPEAEAAIPKLIPLVSDPDDDLRLSAVRALGHMGPSIVTAVPALTLATQDSNPEIRRAAQDGLMEAKRWMSKP